MNDIGRTARVGPVAIGGKGQGLARGKAARVHGCGAEEHGDDVGSEVVVVLRESEATGHTEQLIQGDLPSFVAGPSDQGHGAVEAERAVAHAHAYERVGEAFTHGPAQKRGLRIKPRGVALGEEASAPKDDDGASLSRSFRGRLRERRFEGGPLKARDGRLAQVAAGPGLGRDGRRFEAGREGVADGRDKGTPQPLPKQGLSREDEGVPLSPRSGEVGVDHGKVRSPELALEHGRCLPPGA